MWDNDDTHALNELLAVLVDDALGEPNLAETDVLVHLLRVLGVEGAPAAAHLKQEHAERPEVHELAVPVLVEENFGRKILRRAAECVRQLV